MSAIAYALQVFSLIKSAISAGMAVKDAYDLIVKYEANLKQMEADGVGPTPEQWIEINDETEALRAQRPDLTE